MAESSRCVWLEFAHDGGLSKAIDNMPATKKGATLIATFLRITFSKFL